MTLVITRATKQAARYTDAGGRERCSACRFFMPQGTCGRIIGPVSPMGWCRFYSQEAVQRWQPQGAQGIGGIGPALDLSFMSSTLDPRITYTRASTATYFDATGTMQTAASGAPRFDYDPVTLAARGLLIEEARTNLLLNSATLGTQSVTTTAVATTLSFYGTGTVTLSGTSTAGPLTGTGATNRVALTFTPTAGTLTCTVTGSVTNAQIEVGAFPTSYIPTTAAAVTRAVDVATLPVGAWYSNNASYSLMAELIPTVAGRQVVGIGDAVFGNASYLAVNTFTRSGSGAATGTPLLTLGVIGKEAGTLSPALMQICNNAATIVTNANTQPAQTTATRLSIGCSPWALDSQLSGWIRRVTYWPRVLSNTEMRAVTT